ncbi:MAG: cyclodeaminase/cyclohydrolase family protein, partial [candidate division Zixibacteria bacterium]|nr:cyclodeaminase/cyclohydrolase family protein [candidate division Zixibacteria bacterium]
DKIADAVKNLQGGYRFVKALGFEIKERNQVQVSMNMTNYQKTPLFRVFETIKSEAARYGVNVTSSEIVGLVPTEAIVDVADFYLRLENFSKNQLLEEKLKAAGTFGEPVQESFYDQVASSTPAPGGGSVSASAGALAAALTAMVCRLTVSRKQYVEVKEELSDIRDRADALRKELERLIDDDKHAFNAVMDAFKLPKGTPEEIAHRDSAIEKATKRAAEVPLTVMQNAVEVLKLAKIVAVKGNQNSVSDAGVAGLMGMTAVEGAGYNVRINLASLKDQDFVAGMRRDVQTLRREAMELADEIKQHVESRL